MLAVGGAASSIKKQLDLARGLFVNLHSAACAA